MMKTSKSLVALLLVLCMAMTFVVPATFAATEKIVFDFGNPDASGSYRVQSATLPASPILLRGNATGDNAATNDAYLLNVNSGRGFDVANSAVSFRANASKYWAAIKLCDIKAGTYDMTLSMVMKTSGSGESMKYAKENIYIFSYADYAQAFIDTNMATTLAVTGETNTSDETLRTNLTGASKHLHQSAIERTADDSENMSFTKNDIEFPADGDYVILFRSVEKAAFGVSGLQLTREVADPEPDEVVGGGSLANALENATSGTIIQLTTDVAVEGDIVVDEGVKLDLNGNDLTVSGTIGVSGALIDTAAEPGLVKGTITCTSGNEGYLPLTDGEGYRLYKFNAATEGCKAIDADTAKFGFNVNIDNNNGYALASGLKMNVAMSWNDGSANASTEGGDFVSTWANAVAADENLDVIVTVKGLTGIEGFTLTPSITANGVTISMSAIALS